MAEKKDGIINVPPDEVNASRFQEENTARVISRSVVVVETEIGGRRYIPILNTLSRISEDFLLEYELPGGKINPLFEERMGEKVEIKPDKEYLIAEAKREVIEEIPAYKRATNFSIEPLPTSDMTRTRFFTFPKSDMFFGRNSDLHVNSQPFFGSAVLATFPTLGIIRTESSSFRVLPEHLDLKWIIAPSWDDNTTASEQLRALRDQLLFENGLYILPSGLNDNRLEWDGTYEIVLDRKKLQELKESDAQPTYIPLSKISCDTLYEYFWYVGGIAKEESNSDKM